MLRHRLAVHGRREPDGHLIGAGHVFDDREIRRHDFLKWKILQLAQLRVVERELRQQPVRQLGGGVALHQCDGRAAFDHGAVKQPFC
jgi:hypothetical protein